MRKAAHAFTVDVWKYCCDGRIPRRPGIAPINSRCPVPLAESYKFLEEASGSQYPIAPPASSEGILATQL